MTPDDDRAIVELEAKGIEFQQVDLVKGEIRPAQSRHRRVERTGPALGCWQSFLPVAFSGLFVLDVVDRQLSAV